MPTLREYEERMPAIYRQRYNAAYWALWANALLDRLSGGGMLPPQRLTAEAQVRDGCWVDIPPNCRNVVRVTDNARQVEYRFVEEDGALRLLGVTFPEPDPDADPPVERATLTVLFVAPYMPVESMDDDMGFQLKYENLADTWFRWKIEEQVSAISQECAYWYKRVEAEFARLRAEIFNRMNKPQGRFLAGFVGNKRHA